MPAFPTGPDIQSIPDNPTIDNVSINAAVTAPSAALQQLIQAYQKGTVSYEQMMDVFNSASKRPEQAQVANENIQASKARQSLIPAQTNLAANKISADNSLIQPATTAKLGEIGNITALQPGQLALAKGENQKAIGSVNNDIALQPGQLDLAKAGQGAAIPEAQFAAAEVKQDPTGSLTETRKNFQALHLGNILRNGDGTPDYEGMGAANERLAQLRMGQVILPTQKEILDQLAKRSPEDAAKAYDAKGNLRPTAELAKILAESKPAMTPADTQSGTATVLGSESGLASITKARELLKDNPDVVGPRWDQGSLPGRVGAQLLAMKGNKDAAKKYDAQKQLQVTLAGGILDSIRSLRGLGAIRNTEIVQIEQKQPTMDSSAAQWNAWLTQSEDLLERARRAEKLALPTSVSSAIAGGARILQPAPGQNEAAVKAAQLPTVNSQADKDALQIGTKFQLPDGTVAVKLR